MPYPESFIGPMREELTRLGVQELRTPDEVDAVVRQKSATVMVVVNSMCGCAAGKARPGVALALRHSVTPGRRGDGLRRWRHRSHGAGAQLPRRAPAFVTFRRNPSRGPVAVHVGAASNREPDCRDDRAQPHGGVR